MATMKRLAGHRGTRSRALRSAAVVVAVLAPAVLAGCSSVPGVYVVEGSGAGAIGPGAGQPGSPGAFDANAYVAQIWATKVLPTMTDSAKDATAVLSSIAADPTAAGQTHGRQTGTGSPYTFVIKGEGTVLGVDTSGPSGVLPLDLTPRPGAADGTADLKIAIGPAFLGTAVRDALPFIDFSQFTNQIDYADVATALNAQVKAKALTGLDAAGMKGKKVRFVGAFADIDPKSVVVTPVSLEVLP